MGPNVLMHSLVNPFTVDHCQRGGVCSTVSDPATWIELNAILTNAANAQSKRMLSPAVAPGSPAFGKDQLVFGAVTGKAPKESGGCSVMGWIEKALPAAWLRLSRRDGEPCSKAPARPCGWSVYT